VRPPAPMYPPSFPPSGIVMTTPLLVKTHVNGMSGVVPVSRSSVAGALRWRVEFAPVRPMVPVPSL
jgi:hypothetical protein